MNKQLQRFQLNDSTELVIRPLKKSDASQAVSYLKTMYADSPYLTKYPDEWSISIEDEQKFIESTEHAKNRLMLGVFVHDNLVGLADFMSVGSGYKLEHRCQIGISVTKTYQGKGIGSLLLETLLSSAKQAGYEQMELEVVASNSTAIKLYERNGFIRVGTVPHGFRYKEGYYEDLLMMVRKL
ncbi:MAG: N-acetyltransferase family protein [Sphaerochaetaceae bacterium]